MPRPTFSAVAVAVALALCGVSAGAATERTGPVFAGDTGGSAQVVNGVTSGFFPAVGALLAGDAEHGHAWCSGTLIGCQTFLTAAHCVCASDGATCTSTPPNPSAYSIFFQDAGFVDSDAITVHPDFAFPRADLAVIHLSQPVTRIRPLPVNTDASPAPESAATIVGFGNSGGGNMDYGIKRSGRVVIADGMVGGGDGLVGWHFSGPMGDPGSNANTCSGDSGGPLLLESSSQWTLAGTTSGGQNGLCLTDDVSIDTDVFMYRDWIRDTVGSDDASCAPPFDDALTQRMAVDGVIDDDTPTETHTIDVAPGATSLLVTMNGIDDGRSQFVIDVHGPGGSSAQCRTSATSQFAACELDMPEMGAWQIQVERVSGSGPYQLSAVAMREDCNQPERDGEPCNDGNACTTHDVCRDGLCVGTAVVNDPTCGPRTCAPAPLADCAVSDARQHPLMAWPGGIAEQPSFTWRWMRPSKRAAEPAYGDPTADADYTFCVYAGTDAVGPLLFSAPLRPGPGWLAYRRGFSYLGAASGITHISHARMRTDTRARTTIVLKGDGALSFGRIARLRRDIHVRAQLQGPHGCWETGQTLSRNPVSR